MTPRRARENYIEQGEARVADAVTAERRLQLTVDAIEDYARRIEAFEESLPSRGVTQPIDADLGVVVVDGIGRLVGVRLDQRRLGYSAGDVGAKILAAIKSAEARVKSHRDGRLRELSDSSRIPE